MHISQAGYDADVMWTCREVSLLRATIREDMSMSMVDELMKDIQRAVDHLDHHFTFTDNQVHLPECSGSCAS